VDGGSDRACRGASSDNAASYYIVIGGTSSLDACKDTIAEVYKAVSESTTTVVACVVKSGHVRKALVHQLSPPGTSASGMQLHLAQAQLQQCLRANSLQWMVVAIVLSVAPAAATTLPVTTW